MGNAGLAGVTWKQVGRVDRGTIRWICVITGLALAVVWLFMTLAGTPSVDWVPPSSVVALGLAAAL